MTPRLAVDHGMLAGMPGDGVDEVMDEVCAEWIQHGLSTAPADRDAAAAGVLDACRAFELTPPRTIVWVDSPLAGVNYFYPLCPPVYSPEDRLVNRPFLPRIQEAENDPIATRADDRVYGRIFRTYWSIEQQLVEDADSSIKPRYLPGRQHRYCMRAQFEAGHMSRYDLRARLGTAPWPTGTADVARIARSAGMLWWLPEVTVLCERPREIHLDREGQPHRQDGPAILYPDGWGVYMWHGIRVPAGLIEGDGWSLRTIMRCPNSEIRRCAVERHAAVDGWEALIRRAGWKQVGRTVPDPGNPGQTLSLYEVRGIYDTDVHLLLMTNGTTERDGTRRQYAETIPIDVIDPIAAAAWQIGVPARHYRRSVRRT